MMQELKRKVEDVYKNCIGDNEANIDTLQMLTNIENKLEELFQRIEQMPPEKVEEAEKVNALKKVYYLNLNLMIKHRLKRKRGD
jgi:DNA repair ATPase RecN